MRHYQVVPRLAEYTASVFGEFSALANRYGAINLGQGFPDTDGPEVMKEAAIRAIAEGRGNQYPPIHGLPALREAIAAHQARFYGLTVDPDLGVVVATGASEVLGAAMLALVDEGDEVVMFEPWFDVYAAAISMARGVRVGVPMIGPGQRPDLVALADAITPRTKLLLLNSPHNPTGIVLTKDELAEVARIAIEHDLIVLSDEAYEHLWYDGHPHIPISTLPGMFDRTITVGSAGKSFSFTGWKVGWASGPADLIGAIRTVRQHLSYVSGGPFQWAIAEGLALPDTYFDEFRSGMQMRRDILSNGLQNLGFSIIPSEGSYFLTTDAPGYPDGRSFCLDLPHRAGVVAIPIQALCDDPDRGSKYVRWAYCKKVEVLQEALQRLA